MTRENIYNLRNFREFHSEKKENHPLWHWDRTYKAAQLWELFPYNIKNSSTLIDFTDWIKTWSPDNCPYRLCKRYLGNTGFTDIRNTSYKKNKKQLLFQALFSLKILVLYDYFPFHCIGSENFGCLNTHIVWQTWVRDRRSQGVCNFHMNVVAMTQYENILTVLFKKSKPIAITSRIRWRFYF